MTDYTLSAQQLTLCYGDTTIINQLNLQIPQGQISILIGSNGCGKSTLLRSFARLLQPALGAILLNGRNISRLSTKDVAKQMAVLPQEPVLPEGLTVLQLVRLGRYPYQSLFQQWSEEDEAQVRRALEVTHLEHLSDRDVDSLSGGQRQRAWIAMTLAQDTEVLLLDEPTTYLDMAHQVEILDLLYDLNQNEQRTIVMVLHDLNLACRYAHHIIAVHNKGIHSQGLPETIVTKEMIREVYGMECEIGTDMLFGTPVCIPHGKGRKIIPEAGSPSNRELHKAVL
ncbi:ABC transporter ATP-binding protein [Paenibacillus radicis (ex Xue et al. 2023)]|uniref:ABC transporter ATP-binding protein n=1 Tax=Paenibacillus radicis (ex Xue et al. 2023) TaxID=2972489 RepID=A0ABT1YS20_9BACL|nr:ABC transporter ATP-binding protein [Paenibacillus radicis (ex Xue et al. 2023)]MCR8635098.1 ABC transporter ATP-binding protein [Paenibacillus radicis (ex Xue et al. 2023)]